MARGNVYNALVPSLIDNTDNLAPPDTRAEIDNIITGNGNDVVHGNDVFNTIRLGNGNDHVILGSGGGFVTTGTGSDIIEGSIGPTNTLDYRWETLPIVVSIAGNQVIKELVNSSTETDQFSNVQDFIGGSGNDTFVSIHGPHAFDGQGGINTLDESLETSATFDLQTGQVRKALGPFPDGVDTFVNIQNFIGGSARSTFISNIGTNTFEGGSGAFNRLDYSWDNQKVTIDVGNLVVHKVLSPDGTTDDTFSNIRDFIGGSGDDRFISAIGSFTFDGGPGSNTLDYGSETGPVVISLIAGTATKNNGADGTDNFSNIQSFIGGSGNDTLIAGPGSHSFDGNGGSDTAVFHGPRSEYAITLSVDLSGALRSHVVDQGAAGDGTLDLVRVGQLQFTDITIDPAKTPPTVVADRAGVNVGSSVSTDAAHGVLANDMDPISGDTLHVSAVNGQGLVNNTITVAGTFGSLTLNSDGSYTYTAPSSDVLPASGVAEDVFTYTAITGQGGTATSTLTVTVTAAGLDYIGPTPGSSVITVQPATLLFSTVVPETSHSLQLTAPRC